ncbi:type II secretion system minor pseudopilin GspI [Aestuariibacter salexigens]|uniref:type II secretion system minor pseudopilin GspI n=1 Tax=Aestuariibacter salexigens TaxID=226010 RepID=UPI000406836B|nr:type II secretion system minor pseudopilin GspI [Aestuariibacter salexigens]
MKQTGLTLIEVMVALFIFAVTGSAVMKAAGDHLNSVSQIEQITFATWVANNRLADMTLEDTWPPRNNQRGSEEMAGQTWYWQQKVLKTNDDDLRAVEVSVGLDRDYADTVTTVTTYVAKPTERKGLSE